MMDSMVLARAHTEHISSIRYVCTARYLWNADANQPTGDWYEMQDLHVTKILPQMITLSEPYIQVSFLRYNRGVT